jgi:amidase
LDWAIKMTGSRAFLSARQWAEDIRSKKISSVEALQFHLDRVKRFNPEVNAVVAFDLDRAFSRAAAADAAIARDETWGPLHGVPMTVKESFDVAGLATTWGLPALRNNIAGDDAAAVHSLIRNGAVVFGKTNVPTLLTDWQTFNPIYGTTRNPWDLSRTPGGSSGGAAAALAAGLTPLELGTDIGASIRSPAHHCGVYGHKSSFGVVAQAGHAIPGAEVPLDMIVGGPLARTAEDLDMALDAIAGAEPENAPYWKLSLPTPCFRQLKEARVAVWLEDECCRVDSEIQRLISSAAKAVEAAGGRVDATARPFSDAKAVHALYVQLLRGATGAVLPADLFESQRRQAEQLSDRDQSYLASTLRAVMQTHRSWFLAHRERAALRKQWDAFFQNVDVLLCPIAASAAFPHDQETERPFRQIQVNGRAENYNDQLFWAGLASLAYLPATVAPIGLTRAGLPVGVQIIGAYMQDKTTVEFARLLAAEIGGFRPPPNFS